MVLRLGDGCRWHEGATACVSDDLLDGRGGGEGGAASLRAGHGSSGKAESVGLGREACSRRSDRSSGSSWPRSAGLVDIPCDWNGRRDLRR